MVSLQLASILSFATSSVPFVDTLVFNSPVIKVVPPCVSVSVACSGMFNFVSILVRSKSPFPLYSLSSSSKKGTYILVCLPESTSLSTHSLPLLSLKTNCKSLASCLTHCPFTTLKCPLICERSIMRCITFMSFSRLPRSVQKLFSLSFHHLLIFAVACSLERLSCT